MHKKFDEGFTGKHEHCILQNNIHFYRLFGMILISGYKTLMFVITILHYEFILSNRVEII